MIFRNFLIAALCVLIFSGCKNKEKEARRAELVAMMHGNSADPDIAAAIEKARATVGDFLAVLQKPAANQKQFLVRKAFPAADGKQQIVWVNNVTFDGTLLHGKVDDNTASAGSGIPKDGLVSFPPAEIADWMYNEDGKAVGGHMLRALRPKLTEDEWAKIARQISFKE